VKLEMQTSNVKTTLARLFRVGKRFSKIRAALPASVVHGISESGSGNQLEGTPAYSTIKECRMAQLEAEVQRARAEAMAHEIRRRLM